MSALLRCVECNHVVEVAAPGKPADRFGPALEEGKIYRHAHCPKCNGLMTPTALRDPSIRVDPEQQRSKPPE